jgi:hypothetical protein
MAQCAGITQSGSRCKRIAIDSSEWCHGHAPNRAAARRAYASKGGRRAGRGRPVVEIANLKEQLADLYNSVLDGQVEPKVAAVAAQVANVRTRLVETELKVKEQQELIERLEALEANLESRKGGSRWGA